MKNRSYDAVIVGSGPNGLAAAIRLALEGLSVAVLEAAGEIGGGTRSADLTASGSIHDICSAIHPMAAASPFLSRLPLAEHGLEWIQPELPLAHPLDDGTSVPLHRSLSAMQESLGVDFQAWEQLLEPLLESWPDITRDLLAPLRIPSHPIAMARFGWQAIKPAKKLADKAFRTAEARALFGGLAAHSLMSLEDRVTSAIGMVLGAAGHSVGWPLPRGGSCKIAQSMGSLLQSLGGEIHTGFRVDHLSQLPGFRALLLDITPKQLLGIGGLNLPAAYRSRLARYRYGSGVFKIDYHLSEPVPWRDPLCLKAGTLHLGGTLEEISAAESEVGRGEHPARPFVLAAQQSLFDPDRTIDNTHTLWAYCHVPSGSTRDMTEPIEQQIERFAPGFRQVILARHTHTTTDFERYNANYIGGDIGGGAQDLKQLFCRPASPFRPYATPDERIFLCSSSTPPGGGVHGMCGFHAAELALRQTFGRPTDRWQFRL